MRLLHFLTLGLLSIFVVSCGAHKNISEAPAPNQPVMDSETTPSEEASQEEMLEAQIGEDILPSKSLSRIPDYALEYLGTKYKYGGTTADGMDCSGLVTTAFLMEDISLPRTSKDISLQGDRINLDEVLRGDLLFFETNNRRKVINHVGLVVEVDGNEILFIHSTTSRGVIISSLKENYWRENFVMARRIQ